MARKRNRMCISPVWAVLPAAKPVILATARKRLDALVSGAMLPTARGVAEPGKVERAVNDEAREAALASLPSSGPVEDARRRGVPIRTEGPVAVVDVHGVMMPGGWSWFGECDTLDLIEATKAVANDGAVDAVVFDFDSPGGSVEFLADLGDAMAALAKKKLVVAQVSGMCCSAAYYAACACSSIVSGRMDIIGSIGTRETWYDYSKMFEADGVKAIVVDTGEHKSAGEFGTKITDAQIAEWQRVIDDYFKDFKARILKGRSSKMTAAKLDELADGRYWTAPDALNFGLVDKLAVLDDTIAAVRTRIESTRQLRIGIQNTSKYVAGMTASTPAGT